MRGSRFRSRKVIMKTNEIKLHRILKKGMCFVMASTMLLGTPVLTGYAEGNQTPASFVGINLDPAQGDLLGTEQDEVSLLEAGRASLEEMEESEYADLAIAHVDSYVNVRSVPGTEGQVLGKIYNGAVAHVLEEVSGTDGDWFHVKSGSLEGYIKSEYFLYGKDAIAVIDDYVTRYAQVHASRLNVRKEPSVEADRIGYLNNNEKAKIVENLGDWLKVEYSGGQTGFVAAEYTETVEEFSYAISIEEEKAEIARQKALEERKRQQEAKTPENTASAAITPAAEYSTNSELRDSLVAYALQFVGNPYVNGGNSLTNGTDCSGFTKLIYGEYGYSLGRTPGSQLSSAGRSIDYSEIQKGDIICYSTNGGKSCTHVAIYIGDGMIVHAANSRKGICTQRAQYSPIIGVKNIID